jgi:hypothetical protein
MKCSPAQNREKSREVKVLVSRWWISYAVKTLGQSEAKINSYATMIEGNKYVPEFAIFEKSLGRFL